MFKIILAVLVFSLAACSDNKKSSPSGTTEAGNNSLSAVDDTSNFAFIEDANLRACLDESGMTVQTLHTLVCSGKGVASLQGMQQLPALKNVNLSHNQVTDLSPLAEVKSLEVLYATNNNIVSVDALADLPQLNAISLRSNKLSEADAFYTLPELKKLYLQNNLELELDVSQLPQDVIVAI